MLDWKKRRGLALPLPERQYLLDSAKVMPRSAVIVNIGVAHCGSMYCLRAGNSTATLYGIDIVACPVKISPELKAKFIINDSTKCYRDFHHLINLLFIDGDHHYASVTSDLTHWASKIVPGGRVILHDCHPLPKDIPPNPHLVEVNQAVNDWLKLNGKRWKELKATNSMRAFQRL